jgi:hypothetical protein
MKLSSTAIPNGLLVSVGLFQETDQLFLAEVLPVAVAVDPLTVLVEEEIRRHVYQRCKVVVDLLGLADHPDVGMEFAHYPLQPAFGRGAIASFGPANSDDANLVFPTFIQHFPELHELRSAGGSPTGEKDDQDWFAVE